MLPLSAVGRKVPQSSAAGARCRRAKNTCLEDFLDLLLPHDATLAPLQRSLRSLTRYAVEFRYPGVRATSLHESLSCGAMCELVSNGVLYAKQEWSDDWDAALLDPARLKLLAVATHRPLWLKPDEEPRQTYGMPGVYDIQFLRLTIRVIVPREVAKTPKNALWHLLSGDPELVRYGMEHYHLRNAALYNILNDLKQTYALEGVEMPYTVEDYKREVARELLQKMSPRERLEGLSPREILEGLSQRERLEGLSPEEIQAYLEELRSKAEAKRDQGQQD